MKFYKYQGTGNDFILIDNRQLDFVGNVAQLCDRKFGIGADGLMLLQEKSGYDFEMVYFNSDGNISTMCGNGGRCIVAFAKQLGIIADKAHFLAIDGPHDAAVFPDGNVSLGMIDVSEVKAFNGDLTLNTGSPHYIQRVSDLKTLDLVKEAKNIRYSPAFALEGINVNFIQLLDDGIAIRTYERGVEDETLSCGTGVTAAGIASHKILQEQEGAFTKNISTEGGALAVSFNFDSAKGYHSVILSGPAELVFEGEITI